MRLGGILWLGLTLLGIPAAASKPATVGDLVQEIQALHGKSDADAAWAIADLEPAERISAAKLAAMQREFPGEKSRAALQVLADESVFLNPPANEIPNRPAPDLAEQRRIMSLVVAYVGKRIPQLPNFLATRETALFESTPSESKQQGMSTSRYEPLHLVGTTEKSVSYANGKEVLEPTKVSDAAGGQGLATWGEFGPILSTVLLDAARNKLAWSHWEQGEQDLLAVFSYAVPREKSHYQVSYCCVVDSEGNATNFSEQAAYHGEMVVDPATGIIVRLLVEAEMNPGQPVSRAAILVEYGPVDIGGRIYVCPVRSLALSRAESVIKNKDILVPAGPRTGPQAVASAVVHSTSYTPGPEHTLLNDTAFGQYHVFGSEARIVTENAGKTGRSSSQLSGESTEPGPIVAAAPPEPSSLSQAATSPSSNVPVAVTSAAPPAQPAATTVSAPASPASDSSIPEVSVTGFAPGNASSPFARPDAAYTLQTTTRLVDVGVVALDKKGKPITDLKREDFEIDDNGTPQTIRSFARAGGSNAAPQPAAPAAGPASAKEFSNVAPAQNSVRAEAGNTTILMIDAANLAFGDLNYTRSEMLRFLKALAPGDPVGVYVMKSHGFEVLLEPTTDSALVAAILSKWMPDAQDLANAQDEERRNRREVEYVDNVKDLFAVNGNSPSGKSAAAQPKDPQLRTLGSDPARDAFLMMPAIAQHLAAIGGHKSLVWISSDNALADWSDKASTSDRSNTLMDPLALRAEEAMNGAHVSIYPLDASQLEAGGVAASAPQSNVQLNPAAATQAQLAALPPSERQEAEENLAKSQRDINPGRITETMKQDMHPIQGPVRELADATGGHALRRAGDIAAELSNVVADGDSVYLLSFSPSGQPDDAYHHLTVKLVNHPGLTLRYRTGYLYAKEPATLKDRFRDAVWSPADMSEIALTAHAEPNAKGGSIRLNIAAKDLDLRQAGERWSDRLDIFVAERDDSDLHAHLAGKTLALALKPATYQDVLRDGINFEEKVAPKAGDGSFRVIVVDENSGRMGSVTIPGQALTAKE